MEEKEGTRINKFLSEAGVCSRRQADRETEAGNIMINGHRAVMGEKIFPGDEVYLCGKKISREEERILLLYNKPVGVVCTAEKREKNNIIDVVNYPKRVFPVGRLDKDSEGLILLTNDGSIVNRIMRAGNAHEKEYIVTVNRDVTDEFVKGMSGGVLLEELQAVTRKCRVRKLGQRSFSIILTQGLNRQIRRMCKYFGYGVVTLKRVRIMNLELGDLKTGKYRAITDAEWKQLEELIRDSSNETVIRS